MDVKPVEDGFWKDKDNRLSYMEWLEEELGISEKDGWYQLKKETFLKRRGNGMLANYYKDSPMAALKEYLPRAKWEEWRFANTPQRFWQNPENRRRYMKWLGKKLKFKKTEDWYKLSRKTLEENFGATLLHGYFNGSILNLVSEYIPDFDWKPWCFGSVPQGFWKDKKNRRIYIKWLGEVLGFKTLEDWATLSKRNFQKNFGGGLLAEYYKDSPRKALEEFKPTCNWEKRRAKINRERKKK